MITEETLHRSLASAFEATAFVVLDRGDPEPGARMQAEIAIHTPSKARLHLGVDCELLSDIARELDCDRDVDTLLELVNVVAGVVLAESFGEDGAWSLDLPRVAEDARPSSCQVATELVDELGRAVSIAVAWEDVS